MVRRLMSLALLVALLVAGAGLLAGRDQASSAPGSRADATGIIRVIDADTFDLGTLRVRLHGADAPEDAQTCLDALGKPWPCGDWATAEARALWEGRAASCEILDTDRYGREVARCEVEGQDIGATLVGRGMALAYVAYSDDYLPQQREAEAARAGLWQGEFDAPWDWRRQQREASAGSSEACRIKGNISGSGRIYHLPGSRSYDRTRIDEGDGERWFCSAAEAEAEGWRAPRG
jgi:endonuclease YncB( thermonuclease family)